MTPNVKIQRRGNFFVLQLFTSSGAWNASASQGSRGRIEMHPRLLRPDQMGANRKETISRTPFRSELTWIII